MKKALACVVAASMAAVPSQAAIIGYFDQANINMVDSVSGWLCDSASPYTAPSGTLELWNGTPASGTLVTSMPMSYVWGESRPDVPAAGLCGTNANTGWTMIDWFSVADNLSIYFKFPNNTWQRINGGPYDCTAFTPPGTCPPK
jgi:hypothetical protein